jgi:hypothetical protein
MQSKPHRSCEKQIEKLKPRHFRHPFACAFSSRRMAAADCNQLRKPEQLGSVRRGTQLITVQIHVEPLDGPALPWRDRIVILRGQLPVIRKRAERGIPVSIEAISRAEELARSLEPVQQ